MGWISGISVALAVMWTEAKRRGFALTDIARWMAEGPARFAGCDHAKVGLLRVTMPTWWCSMPTLNFW